MPPLETIIDQYAIRVSARAKHVTLRLSPHDGLTVVVPSGYNQSHIPGLIERRLEWIERASRRLARYEGYLTPRPPLALPEQINCPAIERFWHVRYEETDSPVIEITERSPSLLVVTGKNLTFRRCRPVLRAFLRALAKEHLPNWLEKVSSKIELPYRGLIVRNQKTRWGSCSSKKIISLNMNMMFLPKHLVHYLLVHELCHTRCMNHSERYWAIVADKYRNYKQADDELKKAWMQFVPNWADPRIK